MATRPPRDLTDPAELKKIIDAPFPERGSTVRHYQCRLVTPMYGGGVKAGVVDRDMPIRATAIRGQLRFWWRVAVRNECYVNGKLDPKKMFERERSIWGGLGDEKSLAASKVKIRVLKSKSRIEFTDSEKATETSVKYAFGAAVNNGNAKWLKEGYEWILLVDAPDAIWPEVEIALRWWNSFGGLGARTRRGFGSVQVSEIVGNINNVLPAITKEEAKNASMRLMIGNSSSSAQAAWKSVNGTFHKFRQGVAVGRNEGQGSRPGRSRWPEPDAIRRITESHAPNHSPEHPAGNVFPRAAFGMPIIFEIRGSGEPNPTQLVPKGKDRMASPLIFSPYFTEGKWHAAVLCMPVKHVWATDLELKNNSDAKKNRRLKEPHVLPTKVWWPDIEEARKSLSEKIRPMKATGMSDPLTAFLKYFMDEQKK